MWKPRDRSLKRIDIDTELKKIEALLASTEKGGQFSILKIGSSTYSKERQTDFHHRNTRPSSFVGQDHLS